MDVNEWFSTARLFKVLLLIFAITIIATFAICSLYFGNFAGNLSNRQEIWGTFGDYIGGTLGPVLSFFALIALFVTIIIQSNQLDISVKAQEETLKIMAEQTTHMKLTAQLTALNHMIESIEKRISKMPGTLKPGSHIEGEIESLRGKKAEYMEDLESIYQQLQNSI